MNEQPFEPIPPQPSVAVPPPAAPAVLSPLGQQYLDQTRPWVRFMSILAFIGAGFMALAGAGIMLAGLAGGFSDGGAGGMFGAIGGVVLGGVYLGMACLYIAPGVFLHRFAGSIRQLKLAPNAVALEAALRHQRSFWRYIGIMSLVGLILGVIAVILAVVIGIAGAMLTGRG